MHGLKRAEAAGYPVPPLLDWFKLLLRCHAPPDLASPSSSRVFTAFSRSSPRNPIETPPSINDGSAGLERPATPSRHFGFNSYQS